MELLAKRTTRPELLRVLEDFRAAVGDQFEGLVEGAATSPIMPALYAAIA